MNAKLLLVDDDMHFRRVSVAILREHGFDVIQAASAAEARIEMSATKFELIIVDGILPVTDGVAFIKELRDGNYTGPIIFISSGWRDTASYQLLTETLKVSHVLHKPIFPAELIEHVISTLGQETVRKTTSNVTAKLALMSANFAKEVPAMLADIRECVDLAKNGNMPSLIIDASRKAHMLRGTAGTYGFPQISAAMACVEDTLSAMADNRIVIQSRDGWPEIDRAINTAMQWASEFERWGSATEQAAASSRDALKERRFLFITDDTNALEMDQFAAFANADEAMKAARAQAYDAILIKSSGNAEKLFQTLSDLRHLSGYRDTPMAVVCAEPLPVNECIYSGASFVLKNLPLESELVSLLDEEHKSERRSTVISVDDDAHFGRRIQAVLQQERVTVKSYNDSARILEVLDKAHPDLLLLDVDMPGISGFDVCRLVRRQPQWQSLPIIFVTGSLGWESRISAYEAGGDDYLPKPIVNSELLAKVHVWLERARNSQSHMAQDTLTGLAAHSQFVEDVNRAASHSGANRCQSLGLITVDNLNEINSKQGPRAGDAVLRSISQLLSLRFRPTDIRGRWSGATLAIGLRGANSSVLNDCLKMFEDEVLSLSIDSSKVQASLRFETFDLKEGTNWYDIPLSLKPHGAAV